MDTSASNEQFLQFAVQRGLMTADAAQRCRLACRDSGRSVTAVAVSLELLGPAQVERLLNAVRRAPSVRPVPRDKHALTPVPGEELAPLIEAAVAAEGQMVNRRYKIIGLLGEGGMGTIYLVADSLSDDRQLALKVVQRESMATMLLDQEPAKEFEMLAGLRHPNVETVYHYGVVEEGPGELLRSYFFTCELLKGQDLLFATSKMTWQEMVPLIVQLCRGLQFIHTHELVHLDVKPENALVCDTGQVKLVDFGAARSRRSCQGLPSIIGTVPYIPPEVLKYDPVDHRADLYSLGVTMYELFSRALPYDDDSRTKVMTAHLEAPIPRIRKKVPGLPQEMEDLITRLMAKFPGQRPPSANDVIRTLGRIAGTEYELETKETLKGYVSSGEFVGRDPELSWLKGLWLGIQRGEKRPRVAVISGESGIGKSRLAREFRIWAQTQEAAVAEGKANEGPPEPFGLAQEVLDKVCRQVEVWEHTGLATPGLIRSYAPYLKRILPSLAGEVGAAEPQSLDPEKERLRLLYKTSEFVLEGTNRKGMILIFDDVQWADEMSLRLLEFLGRRAGLGAEGGKLLIVATKREGEESEDLKKLLGRLIFERHAEERVLKPLAKADQDRFIRTMFGDGAGVLNEKLLSVEKSGNPLFLEAVLREWVDEQVLQWRPWGWEVDRERWKSASLPDSVKEVVSRRLGRLRRDERGWLERLAVWGRAAREDEIDWLLAPRPAARARATSSRREKPAAKPGLRHIDLGELIGKGLLRHEASGDMMTYRFAHDRVREMARAGIPAARLRRLSLELLSRLELEIRRANRTEHAEIERLARLAWEGGSKIKYARYGEAAAENAARRYASAEALDAYRRLLEVGLTADKEMEVLENIGRFCLTMGRFAEAETSFKQAIDRCGKAIEAGVSGELVEKARAALARTERKLAGVLGRLGRIDDAALIYERLLETMKTQPAGLEADLERARALFEFGWFRANYQSRFDEGEQLAAEGIDIARSHGEEGEAAMYEGRDRLGAIASLRGDFDKFLENSTALLEYAERKGDKWQQFRALNNAGFALLSKGELARAEAMLTRALKTCEEIGHRWGMTMALVNLGETYRALGEMDRAIDALRHGFSIAEETGDAQMVVAAASELAITYRQRGDIELALDFHKKSARIAEQMGNLRDLAASLHNIGTIHADRGELDRALELYTESHSLCVRTDDRIGEKVSSYDIASILLEKGEVDRALGVFEDARARAKAAELNSRIEDQAATSTLAALQLSRKEFDEVHRTCDAAMAIARGWGARLTELGFAGIKAQALYAQARFKEALLLARDALRAADQANAPDGQRGALYVTMCLAACGAADKEAADHALAQAERLVGDAAPFARRLDVKSARARREMAFGDGETARSLYRDLIDSLQKSGYVLRVRETEEELRRIERESCG
ncbi:MAG: tetratricopeptide repeat protein [Planctomycetota bacterium]|nr:tetratricopeptide repeat protein [Planctomycetota bacterium]